MRFAMPLFYHFLRIKARIMALLLKSLDGAGHPRAHQRAAAAPATAIPTRTASKPPAKRSADCSGCDTGIGGDAGEG